MVPSKANEEQPKQGVQVQSWSETYRKLMADYHQKKLTAEELQTLSQAAYLKGRDNESLELLTLAHQHFLDRNDLRQAARCAFWMGMQLMFKGEQAKGNGWFSKAAHLLTDFEKDCAEKGLLSIPLALKYLSAGNAQQAYAEFTTVAKAGKRFQDPELAIFGLLGCGQSLIGLEKYAQGVALLDEAMVSVTAEALSPIVAGIVYCAVIETCMLCFDMQRAQEWTKALSQWCAAQPELVPFRGQCLVRRAQILQLHGEWPEALEELHKACELLSLPPAEPAAGEAYYQLADLHRLQGNYSQATALFDKANMWGRKPQPGLALLRLAQKNADAAMVSVQNTLDEAKNGKQRIGIIPAYIEIMLAAGKIQQARQAAESIRGMSLKFNVPFIHALAAATTGAVWLEEGNAREAIIQLRDSCDLWNELNAPYQAAQARLLMGLAYRKKGDEDSATMELSAACWVFQQLAATPDLKKVQSMLKNSPSHNLQGLSLREQQVLRLVSAGDTNQAIANKLFISEKTVERHMSNIFQKLAVRSRTAAAAYAFRHNLL